MIGWFRYDDSRLGRLGQNITGRPIRGRIGRVMPPHQETILLHSTCDNKRADENGAVEKLKKWQRDLA